METSVLFHEFLCLNERFYVLTGCFVFLIENDLYIIVIFTCFVYSFTESCPSKLLVLVIHLVTRVLQLCYIDRFPYYFIIENF